MKRLIGSALLLGVAGGMIGCSVPSYRVPAGFSSTFSRGMTPPGFPAADAVTAMPPNYDGAGVTPPPVGVFNSFGGTSDLNLVDRWN